MARTIHRLTPMAITKKKTPGTYADGGGLWLQVTESASKSWSFRFMLRGRAREMGLGPLHTIDLPKARDKSRACRELLLEGIDPIEHRKALRNETALNATNAKTFDDCAKAYIEARRPGMRFEPSCQGSHFDLCRMPRTPTEGLSRPPELRSRLSSQAC